MEEKGEQFENGGGGDGGSGSVSGSRFDCALQTVPTPCYDDDVDIPKRQSRAVDESEIGAAVPAIPEIPALAAIATADKAVSTNVSFEDLQRALTYEAVFTSLLEKKMLAMKRDCEERKRAKRMKRKSIGRIFFPKRFFGGGGVNASRKGSVIYCADSEPETTQQGVARSPLAHTRSADEIEMASTAGSVADAVAADETRASAASGAVQAINAAVVAAAAPAAEDSITSTLSNSSERAPLGGSGGGGGGVCRQRSLVVRAQTHTTAELNTTTPTNSSSSTTGEVARSAIAAAATVTPTTTTTPHSSAAGGSQRPASLASISVSISASCYENGRDGDGDGDAVLHASTMADDSLTMSMRDDSIESLSFASSRCTVSFGGLEIIPDDSVSLLYERALAAKRLRVLEAKSISAQCSPVLPRHLIPLRPKASPPPPTTPTAIARPPAPAIFAAAKPRILPQQVSYTESMYGAAGTEGTATGVGVAGINVVDLEAAYSRFLSRQNTSDESANLTISTLLNHSDSLSLHHPHPHPYPHPHQASAPPPPPPLGNRYKSKSTSLLSTASRQLRSPANAQPQLPLAQLKALHITNITSNISHSERLASYKIDPQRIEGTTEAVAASMSMAPAPTTNGLKTVASAATAGCCTTTKPATRAVESDREKGRDRDRDHAKQRFQPSWPSGQTGSDDEYRRRKRKYKRHHRCSDPVLVYPSPSGLQHCILTMPPDDAAIQYPYGEDYVYDAQLQLDSDKHDDLEEIVPSSQRRHRRHRHHRHKKRHRHKKPKILVQDLETEEVKVIDPHDLSQRARWTIIATACLLLLMCLMLVGVTLRMAPLIDDMGKCPPTPTFQILHYTICLNT